MKWWARLKDLRNHRWLPFYLPIIGTILYILFVLVAVPSQFGDKSDADSADAEKTPADKASAHAVKKLRRPGPLSSAVSPSSPPNP